MLGALPQFHVGYDETPRRKLAKKRYEEKRAENQLK